MQIRMDRNKIEEIKGFLPLTINTEKVSIDISVEDSQDFKLEFAYTKGLKEEAELLMQLFLLSISSDFKNS